MSLKVKIAVARHFTAGVGHILYMHLCGCKPLIVIDDCFRVTENFGCFISSLRAISSVSNSWEKKIEAIVKYLER